jgi:uncharacterized protein YbjT (DUF2867 family)
MEPSITHKPILVVGGTGKTGKRVAQRLQALGRPLRIGARSATPAFDWEDRSTWEPALQGTSAAYVTYVPDLSFPGAEEAIATFASFAVRSGLERVVLLSGRGEEGAQRSEAALLQSALPTTILRANFFAQNFSEGLFLPQVLAGEIAFLAGEVPEPFIDVTDIADVAVAALLNNGHTGKIYTLSGPRSLTFSEATEEIARATGRPLRYQHVTPAVYIRILSEQGLPPEAATALTDLFTTILDGRNTQPTTDVSQVLGRPARDFATYVRETAATGLWNASAGSGNG